MKAMLKMCLMVLVSDLHLTIVFFHFYTFYKYKQLFTPNNSLFYRLVL